MSKVVEQERGNFWTDQIFRVGAGALPNIYCLPASKTREYVLKFEKKVQYLLFLHCISASIFYILRNVSLSMVLAGVAEERGRYCVTRGPKSSTNKAGRGIVFSIS